MEPQLSAAPIWLDRTPEIEALKDRALVIHDATGGETPVKLRIESADPRGPHAGKCSVAAQQAMVGKPNEWSNRDRLPPTEQINSWKVYLNEAAINSIKKNEDDPEFGELVLTIAQDTNQI